MSRLGSCQILIHKPVIIRLLPRRPAVVWTPNDSLANGAFCGQGSLASHFAEIDVTSLTVSHGIECDKLV